MNGMGEKLLARPRGAQNQHGFIKPGIIAGLAFQPMHHPAFANQVAKGVLGRETGLHAPFVLRNFAVQMLDFAGKALKLLGIVEDGLRNHARYLAVPAPHWYAVDDYRVFVARAQAAQFAHFRHAPLHDLGRARMWNDFPDVPAKNLAGLKAQQVGVGLVDKADNHCPVAKQHAHWQAVQNQGFRRCGFHGYDLLVFVFLHTSFFVWFCEETVVKFHKPNW